MYELVQVAPRTYYINCPSKTGIYQVDDTHVWLIDTGGDKDAGRKIQKILESKGWIADAIINTHSNADHIGGNTLLQTRLGCRIFSTPMENSIIESPILEPSFLYGGYPFKKLRNKFLMATPSHAEDIGDVTLPEGMEIFPLGGHFLQMIGVKTPDNVYFLADAVFSESVLEKYHISFHYDVAAFFKTLDMIETLEGACFIPSHAEATTDIKPLVEANRKKANEVITQILTLCQSPIHFEALLQKIFEVFHLTMDYGQYVLVGSTIRSYLSYLYDSGRMDAFVENNLLLWHTIEENTKE